MTSESTPPSENQMPDSGGAAKVTRGAMQVVGGAVPFVGGVLSALAGAWSERDQEKVNRFFEQWVRMLEDEIREKEATVVEIMARLDLNDEKISARVESKDFQSLVKKSFRDWAGVESEAKRVLIRNILANAAAASLTSDDVIRLFIDWIGTYSELHFQIIGAIFNTNGITRGEVWRKLGRDRVREDSAEADLFKLLFRELTMGSVIRQHRETDYAGNFIAKQPTRRSPPTAGGAGRKFTSAFDDDEAYELTELGKQFVHYAMTDLPPRIAYEYKPTTDASAA